MSLACLAGKDFYCMEQVLLSVVVPVYQVEAYLPRCLDSILAQTFSDFELILVDDGCSDRSPAIMADYASRDRRVRQVHKENGGLSSARNAGMEVAKGKYIVFIDSDDYIAQGLFADAVAAAEKSGAEQVIWNYQKVDDERVYEPRLQIKDEVLDLDEIGLRNYFYDYWFPYVHGYEACNKLYRRDVIMQNELRFQLNHEILAEDQLFNAMYLMHTHKIAALSKPYYFYYQRSGSIMNSAKPRSAHRLMTLAVRLYEYVCSQHKDKELKDVLPVLCYLILIIRGIRMDPNMDDVYAAMEEFKDHKTMRKILRQLLSPMPLTVYTLRAKRNYSLHLWARLFAVYWLRGDISRAIALVQR